MMGEEEVVEEVESRRGILGEPALFKVEETTGKVISSSNQVFHMDSSVYPAIEIHLSTGIGQ